MAAAKFKDGGTNAAAASHGFDGAKPKILRPATASAASSKMPA